MYLSSYTKNNHTFKQLNKIMIIKSLKYLKIREYFSKDVSLNGYFTFEEIY